MNAFQVFKTGLVWMMGACFAFPAHAECVACRPRRSSAALSLLLVSALALVALCLSPNTQAAVQLVPATPAQFVPLTSVRLLDRPFADAVKANRVYLLALEPDRLLAPFFREAGLELKARPYGNWESIGLDGYTAGHYLSALATMIAAGADTPDGELKRRLESMVAERAPCQQAAPAPSARRQRERRPKTRGYG